MFCTNCGAKVEEGQCVCSECGTPVVVEEAAASVEVTEQVESVVEPAAEETVQAEQFSEPKKESATKKSGAKPVKGIVFAVIYPIFVFVMAFVSMIRNIITSNMVNVPFNVYSRSLFINLGLSLLVWFFGAVLVFIVMLLRRKKLAVFTLKDIFAECIFIVGYEIVKTIISLMETVNMARFGSVGVAALSTGTRMANLMSISAFIGCAAVATYILAKTDAKIASFIVLGAAVVIAAFVSVIAIFAGISLGRIFFNSPEVLHYSVSIVRLKVLVALFTNAAILFGAWSVGSSRSNHAFWPFLGSIVAAAGALVAGSAFVGLGIMFMEIFRLGPVSGALSCVGICIGVSAGALVAFIIFLKSKRKAAAK